MIGLEKRKRPSADQIKYSRQNMAKVFEAAKNGFANR